MAACHLVVRRRPAFTLIELLLVIGIIAILASIVIVAINPTKQLGDARNAQRRQDVNTVLNAVYQYSIDKKGALPTGIAATDKGICVTGAATCVNGIDLTVLTQTGTYLVKIPSDPKATTATGAGYNIRKDANGRLTVTAPLTEPAGSTAISVTR
jgi:prepilin-type N-terminal cleavage/methylation domain-containing protein